MYKKKSTICYEHNNIITFDYFFQEKKCDSLDSVYEHNNTINLYNDISSIYALIRTVYKSNPHVYPFEPMV